MNTRDSSKLCTRALVGLLCLFLSGLCLAQQRHEAPIQVEAEHAVEIGPGGQFRKETGYRTGVEEDEPLHAHFLWDSRYVSEGRDNLDGRGLASVTSDLSIHNFTFAPWIAHGYDADYSELNLNAIYGTQLSEHVEVDAGYTHLQKHEPGDNAYDSEVGV